MKPLPATTDSALRIPATGAARVQELLQHAELLGLLGLAVGVCLFAREYLDLRLHGFPFGYDTAADLAYIGELRNQLLSSGQLLTWYSVAFNGMPLLGHPLTHVFYPVLTLPMIAMGAETGPRISYALSLLIAATGMYSLARLVGARPMIALTVGMIFAMSGTLAARIYAGHVERVLAIPLIPWVLVAILLVGKQPTRRSAGLWATLAGLLTGLVFLAGDSYLLLFLVVTIPPVLYVIAGTRGSGQSTQRFLLVAFCWAVGVLAATAAKLLAGLELVSSSLRSVDQNPFLSSQDWYWSVIHLVFPFVPYGMTLPGQARPDLTPGHDAWTRRRLWLLGIYAVHRRHSGDSGRLNHLPISVIRGQTKAGIPGDLQKPRSHRAVDHFPHRSALVGGRISLLPVSLALSAHPAARTISGAVPRTHAECACRSRAGSHWF